MNVVNFEDISLTIFSRIEIINYFSEVLLSKSKKYITFINPEIFLQQDKDVVLHNYFKNADKNFVDGINLLYAINSVLKTKYNSSDRLPGTDFFEYLPNNQKINIFFYGAQEENCLLAKQRIEEKYSNIKICGYINGYTDKTDEEIVSSINNANTDILIVCLGCPKQELWINQNYKNLKTTIVFGNGGSIDFWSGKTKRAPDFFIKIGFEWFYRLFASFSLSRVKRQSKLLIFLIKYKLKKYKILLQE